MNTMTRIHSLEYTLDGLPALTLNNHRGDILVVPDGAPGEVRITLTSNQPVDFDLEARADGTRVTVMIPHLPAEAAAGISFNLGALSFALGGGLRVDADVHCPPDSAQPHRLSVSLCLPRPYRSFVSDNIGYVNYDSPALLFRINDLH